MEPTIVATFVLSVKGSSSSEGRASNLLLSDRYTEARKTGDREDTRGWMGELADGWRTNLGRLYGRRSIWNDNSRGSRVTAR